MSGLPSLKTILKALGTDFLSLSDRGFEYGSQGKLLRRNVESLWFERCVTAPPYNVFLASSDKIPETLTSLHESTSDLRPFGLATIEDTKTQWNTGFHSPGVKSYAHRIAKVTIVMDEDNGKDIYHKKQRERKVWWRKFSRNPSRFALAEAKKVGKNRETIDIAAKFSFGDIIVETIIYQQDARKIYPQIVDQEGSSSVVHVVEHIAALDWGTMVMLCDGYEVDEANSFGELKIHPKLSPYKVGFYLDHDNENDEDPKFQEKTRLVFYLNNLLKSKGLDTVLTRTKRGIENFHVPMTISVDDASLQNGIVRVRSQLTMISEAVHVTDLPKYVAARCA